MAYLKLSGAHVTSAEAQASTTSVVLADTFHTRAGQMVEFFRHYPPKFKLGFHRNGLRYTYVYLGWWTLALIRFP